MSRLKALLHVATPSTCNMQKVQHTHYKEGKQWQEFEALLAIVGPAYNTPAHEFEWAREAARGDLEAALVSYREMAAQIPHMRRRGG
jgi:protein-disulfide isomerase-like protein with CxxC motif